MLTTTALFTEYLVIGSTSWLWLLPIMFAGTTITPQELLMPGKDPNAVQVGLLVLLTYVVGVLTESLSFGLEKIVVGRTSNPREWVNKYFGELTADEWLAAQQFIWTSDGAFREFIYSRLRITISRGVVTNGILAACVVPILQSRYGNIPYSWFLFLGAITTGVLGSLSWWWATGEYRSRVRVAGQIQKGLPNQAL